MVGRAGRAISGGCSRASPMPTTSAWRRWGYEAPTAGAMRGPALGLTTGLLRWSQAPEADPSLLGAVEFHVADLLGRNQDFPALFVADDEHAAVAQGRPQRTLAPLPGGRRLDHHF